MKIYAKYDGEVCELLRYQNSRSEVMLRCESEGLLKVQKNEIELVGFRNGKGDSGELKML